VTDMMMMIMMTADQSVTLKTFNKNHILLHPFKLLLRIIVT